MSDSKKPQLVYVAHPGIYLPSGKLVGDPVNPGDVVKRTCGAAYRVLYFRPPHSPASSGKVTVRVLTGEDEAEGHEREFYVGIIGAEWINRTDR